MTDNKKKRCIWLYFVAFAIPVLTMLAHMFLTNCYPFGGNTILIGDADGQYVPFLSYMMEKFKNGGSLQFDWHRGLGYDYYATFFYYLASPFNLLMFLFGTSNVELGALVIFLAQIGGCGVTALYFFRHTKYNRLTTGKNMMSLLFAMAYVMCDYILAYQYNFIWLISLMLTPLVLLGIEYMVDRRDYRLYFVSLLLTLITNFYFAWYVCIFAVIYFVDQRYDGVKDFFKKFLKFVCASVVAALCAAVVLIPCYLSVLNRDVDSNWYTLDNLHYGRFGRISDFIIGFFFGRTLDVEGYSLFVNNNYCGIFTLILTFLFLLNKVIEKKHRIKRAVELIIIVILFNWIVSAYILQGFTIPHCYISRFMFILIMLLLITAMECLTNIDCIRYRNVAITVGMFMLLYILGVVKSPDIAEVISIFFTVIIAAYYFICLILLKRGSVKKISLYINIFILGLLELLANAILSSEKNYKYSDFKKINYENWEQIYEGLNTGVGERKTSWMGDTNTTYSSDGSIFSSVINSSVLKLYKNLGLTYQKNGGSYAYHGTTPVSSSLFDMRYVLTDSKQAFGGYEIRELADTYSVLEAERKLYFGFVMPPNVLDWNIDFEGVRYGNKVVTPIDVQNNLTDDIMRVGQAFDEYIPNNIHISTSYCMALGRKKKITDIGLPRYLQKREGVWYRSVGLDSSARAIIYFEFVVDDDLDLYAYIYDDKNSIKYSVNIDGQDIGEDNYPSGAKVVHIGKLKKGQQVKIAVANTSNVLEYGVTTMKLYSLNQETIDKYYEKINQSVFDLEKFEDRDIKGSVNAAEDGILYMSVPYFKGFKVYVDGKQADIVKVGGAMLGVRISAGEHDIHITYRTYGLVLGGILSCIGVLMVLAYVIVSRKRNQSMIKKD